MHVCVYIYIYHVYMYAYTQHSHMQPQSVQHFNRKRAVWPGLKPSDLPETRRNVHMWDKSTMIDLELAEKKHWTRMQCGPQW
jgi:hypothetical protein